MHICRTSEACPASSAVPFAASSSKARSTADSSTTVPSPRPAATSRCSAPGSVATCRGRPGDGVDRGSVGAPQRLWFVNFVTWCGECHRPSIQHLIDKQVHQGLLARGQVRGADLALCFGADMPHLPGGAAFLHYGEDVIGGLCDPAGVGDGGGLGGRGKCRLHHRCDGAASAQYCCCFVQPGGALLNQRAGFVFGVAGLNVACWARCNASTGVGGRP